MGRPILPFIVGRGQSEKGPYFLQSVLWPFDALALARFLTPPSWHIDDIDSNLAEIKGDVNGRRCAQSARDNGLQNYFRSSRNRLLTH